MAFGDLYEVTLSGRMYEQQVVNVFHYHQGEDFLTTNPTQAQALAEGFRDQKLPSIRQLTSADVTFTSIDARNLYNAADQFTIETVLPGQNTPGGDLSSMSSFNAYSFTLQPSAPVVRPGSKRFAGVADRDITDGVVTSAQDLGYLQDVADALETPINIGLILPQPIYYPVVVKRVRTGAPGSYSYRLPANSSEGVYSRIAAALFNVLITSQLSRKIGRGV